MTNTNATVYVTVSVDKPDWGAAIVPFNLDEHTAIAANGEVFPRKAYNLTLDANGVGTIKLPVYDANAVYAWRYQVNLPDKHNYIFYLAGDPSTVTLAEILASQASNESPDSILGLVAGKQDKDATATDGYLAIFASGQTVAGAGAPGTAAYEDTTAFDAAGAAATVQGNLNTHTGQTGTAVHGLGSAATLTAGVVGENFVELPNGGAIAFVRVNADGTVSQLSAADYRTALDLYATTAFSAAPGAAEAPLKTTAAGYLTLVKLLTLLVESTTGLDFVSNGNITFTGGNVRFTKDNTGGTQFVVSGQTDPNKQLLFGVNTTSGNGYIQVITQGVDEKPLDISAKSVNFTYFGTVGASINTGTGNIDGKAYSVNGAAGASGSFTTVDGKTVTVTNGLITAIV